MSTNTVYYYAYGLTGNTQGTLDYLNGNNLIDGEIAFAHYGDEFYVYKLNAYSGASENVPYVISPDTNAGIKRWIRQQPITVYYSDALITSISQGSNIPSGPLAHVHIKETGVYWVTGNVYGICSGTNTTLYGYIKTSATADYASSTLVQTAAMQDSGTGFYREVRVNYTLTVASGTTVFLGGEMTASSGTRNIVGNDQTYYSTSLKVIRIN
jgi:hypothetical protein